MPCTTLDAGIQPSPVQPPGVVVRGDEGGKAAACLPRSPLRARGDSLSNGAGLRVEFGKTGSSSEPAGGQVWGPRGAGGGPGARRRARIRERKRGGVTTVAPFPGGGTTLARHRLTGCPPCSALPLGCPVGPQAHPVRHGPRVTKEAEAHGDKSSMRTEPGLRPSTARTFF